MGNYYFVAASLPPLVLGEVPEISFEEFASRLELNLSKEDLEKTVVLRRIVDLFNLRALFQGGPIDPRGNFDEKEIDEALLQKEGFPEYVYEFLERYETKEERLLHFSQLLTLFFSEEIPKQKGFLKKLLSFEREWRLVILALRCKEAERDVAFEMQFEDFSDPLALQILAQKDVQDFDPPAEYRDLKEIYLSCDFDPWRQHLSIGKYRFAEIEEMVKKPLFSIDWILAYMAQLMIVEHWNELSSQKGMTLIEAIKEG